MGYRVPVVASLLGMAFGLVADGRLANGQAGGQQDASTARVPFAVGDTVTLQFSEQRLRCTVSAMRGPFVRCKEDGRHWYNTTVTTWVTMDEKLQ
jgi:hypothetical protein